MRLSESLDEVFGGSRSGQEGSMSTKCCTCQCFRASQEAISSPAPAPGMLRECSGNAPGDAPGSLARVSNVYCLVFGEPLVFEEADLDRPDQRSAGLDFSYSVFSGCLWLLGLSGCIWLLVVVCVQWLPMVACSEVRGASTRVPRRPAPKYLRKPSSPGWCLDAQRAKRH